MTAPLHYDWARYKMLFTMMETRRLHPDYVIRCNCSDEIVVPSYTAPCVPGFLRGLGGGDRFYGKQQRAGRISLIGCTAQLHGTR
jgi:hypothetical protein